VRILQLTVSAIVFMLVSGLSLFLIESWSGGRLQRWHSAPFTGSVGDECLAPNGGPAEPQGNSGVSGGPPSVS
jgi:hypothetical protein